MFIVRNRRKTIKATIIKKSILCYRNMLIKNTEKTSNFVQLIVIIIYYSKNVEFQGQKILQMIFIGLPLASIREF